MILSIGTKLKMVRAELNLSQAEVAEQLMVTRQTLSKWELDKSLPDLMSLKDLALFYNLSLDALLEMAKEKIRMLSVLSHEELSKLIASRMNKGREPRGEQEAFVLHRLIQPLLSQVEGGSETLWFAIQQQPIIPSRYYMPNYGMTAEDTKECLAFFPGYSYKLWLLTKTHFIVLNLIDWFEKAEFTTYQLSELDFLAVGNMYDAKMTLGNPAGLCYRMKTGQFDLVTLADNEAETLCQVLRRLDSEGAYFIEVTAISLTQFYKKYAKKGYAPPV